MKKIVKIGIFVDGDFIPSYDGASNRFHYLSRYLAKNEAEVVIFHGYRKWSDLSLIKKEPFKTYVFPIENYYNNLELIASIIRRESIDIIQFDNLEPILLQGIRLAELTGARLVSEMHYVVRNLAKKLGASEARLGEIENAEREVGKSIDHLICLSGEDTAYLEKFMHIPRERISVIPSGVDLKEVRFVGPNFLEKNIIFLGNLYFKPNEDAVRAIRHRIYPELKQHGFRFTIAGDCPPALRDECSAEGFVFIGTIPDLNRLFENATFALAPIDEGTGMRIKLLNYLAAGIPVMTTSVATSGFDEKDCFFIEDDYSKYAEKISLLLKNERRLRNVSERGYRMIKERFDWDIIARQTIDVYGKIFAAPNAERGIANRHVVKVKEPVWLQEAVEKERFKMIPTDELPDVFSFSIINEGKIEPFQINKIVALEGMPGAGKTTCIKNISGSNSAVVPQLWINDEHILHNDDLETSKRFLLAEKDKSKLILELGRNHSEIIVDRTFLTTLAYCYARSKINNNQKEFEDLLNFYNEMKKDIIFPTHVVLMDVSTEKSIGRRAVHSENEMYQNWFNPSFLEHFRDFYKKELGKLLPLIPIRIDTSPLTPGEAAESIIKAISRS